MSKILKKFNHKLKKMRDDDSREPLMDIVTPQFTELVAAGDSRSQTTTETYRADPEMHSEGFEAEGQRILSILRELLVEDLRSQELKLAKVAEQTKRWAKMNGYSTLEGKEGNYSEHWLREYHKIVESSVNKNFPKLPPEGSTESQLNTNEYLKLAVSVVCSEVIGLGTVLEDSGLLSFLIESYNNQLFAYMNVLMDRSSSVKEALYLLQWMKQTYISHDSKGSSKFLESALRVSDPLLLTDWFEKSRQKLLTLLQDFISSTLQNVLLYSEAHFDYSSEEDLIKVYLDVIQCLNAALQGTKQISLTLMTDVQRLCCDELHRFVLRYLIVEQKHLETLKYDDNCTLHLFRISATCRNLRSYALNIVDVNNNTGSSTVLLLEDMQAQVAFKLQLWLGGLAEVHLKKYFKENNIHIENLMNLIKEKLAPFSQMEQDKETKEHIVNAAYRSVSRSYLCCLMRRNCRQLEKRWGDIQKRMMNDAELIHSTFKQLLSISDDQHKTFLLKMGEILGYSDMNSLKIICADLYKNFPKESEEHLATLLQWKKGLSKKQIKEILDVSQGVCQHGDHNMSHGQKYWSCFFCCCT